MSKTKMGNQTGSLRVDPGILSPVKNVSTSKGGSVMEIPVAVEDSLKKFPDSIK
ncbi:hypothetical protein IVY21_01320 [Salmonella enterica subsp. enterica serovar Worthington]|nr:hypothetical protein [Salmonella enterica subsp. enterica serovar Worthington]